MASTTIRRLGLAGALAAAGILLVGCSSGATSGSADPAVPPAAAPEQALPDQGGTAEGADRATTGGVDDAVRLEQDRDLVVTASTTVRAEDVPSATAQTLALAAKHRALVVGQNTTTGADPAPQPVPVPERPTASSTITMRVDPASLDALLADVAALGEVVSVTRDVADVTTEVADVDARVRTAQASLARVRALLSRAQNLSDIVALEAELSTRQAALESLQAQQRALADATARATLTVLLLDVDTPVADEPATGFLAGLERGWTAFTGALAVGLTLLGAALPFLVVLALLAGIVVLVVRRSARTRTGPDEPA